MSNNELIDRLKKFIIDNTFWVDPESGWEREVIDVDLLHDELDEIKKDLNQNKDE
jgi:hypothetical protein